MIADYKNPYTSSGPVSNWTYLANVKNISNMYPYGKSYGANGIYNATDDYLYGFNGMEKAKEVDENTNTTHFRNLDLDFGGWWSRDPEESKFPHLSPYSQFDNNPIKYSDVHGNASKTTIQGNNIYYTTKIHMFGSGANQSEVDKANSNFKNLSIRVPGNLKNNYYSGQGHLQIITDQDGKDWNIYLNVEFVYTPELDNEFKNVESLKNSNLEVPDYIPKGKNIQMAISGSPTEGHVGKGQRGGNKSYYFTDNNHKNTPSHEGLHNMGFGDRLALLYGNDDKPPIALEIEGFEGDIMMLGGGIINTIHFENILKFVKQNLPTSGNIMINSQPKVDDAEPEEIK